MLSHYILPVLLLQSLIRTTAASILGSAAFVSSSKAYKVSSVQACPKDFTASGAAADVSVVKSSTTVVSKDTGSSDDGTTTPVTLSDGVFLLNTDSNYEAFFLNVTVSGNSTFPLLIDTASPYLWVYGTDCGSDACSDQALYTPTSAASSSATFALDYSSGTASGDIAEVALTINDELSIQNFNIGVATTAPDIFDDYNISGVVGLPSAANDTLNGLRNLVAYLYASESIDEDLFSIVLNNGSSNYDGLLSIGQTIDGLYEGNISYTDVIDNDQSYWKIAIDDVYVDDYHVEFANAQTVSGKSTNDSRLAIVDSGTTIMVLNKKDAATLHSFFTDAVSDGSNFAIFCNETLTIGLEIGGANFSVGSTSYIGTAYPDTSIYYGYCVSNFQGLDVDDDGSWILGGLFMKNVYSVFNLEKNAVGFAQKSYNDISISSASYTSTIASAPSSTAWYAQADSSPSGVASNSTATTLTMSSSTTTAVSSSASSSSAAPAANSTSTDSVGAGSMAGYNTLLSCISILLGLTVI